eukprot:scaffold319413_cov24-Tisochrysis_lutea.AAC.1
MQTADVQDDLTARRRGGMTCQLDMFIVGHILLQAHDARCHLLVSCCSQPVYVAVGCHHDRRSDLSCNISATWNI